MHPRTHRVRHPGFTLIELLVVIAVIAILAALLFPVFAQSRQSANRARCLSNMRQLGLAIEMYKADNEGQYPMVRSKPEGDVPEAKAELFVNWSTLVFPYIRSGHTPVHAATYSGVFVCPADPGVPGRPLAPGVRPMAPFIGPSYAVNAWFLAGLDEAEVTHPALTVLLAEKRSSIPLEHFTWWKEPWPGWPLREGTPVKDREPEINSIEAAEAETPVTPQSEAVFQEHESAGLRTLRHFNGANYLFTDGHVRWAALEAIWGNATTTNQFWPTRPAASGGG